MLEGRRGRAGRCSRGGVRVNACSTISWVAVLRRSWLMRSSRENSVRGGGPAQPVRSSSAKAWSLIFFVGICILGVLGVRRLMGRSPAPPRSSRATAPENELLPRPQPHPLTTRRPLVAPALRASSPANVRPPPTSLVDAQQAWIDVLGCWDRNACPSGTVCWMGDDGHLGCFESNCRSVEDRENRCGDRQACRAVNKLAEVYRCIAAGRVGLGGSCLDPMLATPARSCMAGLNCVNMVCRKACDPAATSACAAGEVCVRQTIRDWACMPGCSSDAECGSLACIRKPGAARGTCVAAPEGTCRPDRPDSCPSGETCDNSIIDGRMLTGTCRPTCSANSCPTGSTCWAGFDSLPSSGNSAGMCLQSCSEDRQKCPPDHVCMALDERATTWGCRRVAHDARPAIDVSAAHGSFADSVATPQAP